MKSQSWWDLLRYIINFFLGKKRQDKETEKKKEDAQKEHFKRVDESLRQNYKELDKKKEEEKRKDVKDRLNNMF